MRFAHTAIVTENLEEIRDFYRDVVGLKKLREYEYCYPEEDKTLGYADCHQSVVLFQAADDGRWLKSCALTDQRER